MSEDRTMKTAFTTQHVLVAALGQPIEGSLLLSAEFGPGAKSSGAGDDDRYLSQPSRGLEAAATRNGIVKAIFFKAEGIESFAQYAGSLPNGATFADSRAVVREAFGQPALSGEAGGTGIMAISHSWDRFEDSVSYLRFEYETGETKIRMVTIGLIESDA
jgi:hypothetical protein